VEAPQRLCCTLVARWDEGYTDPWLVVTDLPQAAANVLWYSMRIWIEGYQARRLAVASNQDDRSATRQSAVVGDCGSDLMGGECRRRGGCYGTLQYVAGVT
jgi:hypothetical protein